MTFESLSPELVYIILVYSDVSINDVCNVSQSSTRLNEIIKNENSLWKKKFVQRWPTLVKAVEHDGKNWLQRVQHKISIENEMNRIVQQMAKECGSVYQPTLESVVASLSICEQYECVEDSILKKAYKNNRFQSSSLTEVFCAKYLLRYLRSGKGDRDIQDYLKEEKKELLKGAFLVSQWGSLTEELLPQWGEVTDMLNNIHSHFWYNLKNLTGKQLTQSKLKLNVIVKTFFDDMNFVCDTVADFDKTDWEQRKKAYYIVEVLRSRTGKAILLALILEDLLKTYDFSSEIVSVDTLIYLKVKLLNAEFEYIDFENHCLLRNQRSLNGITVVEDAIFGKIIIPLHDIATPYLQPDNLKRINNQQLADFDLNFKRMMCAWKTDDLGLYATYAMSCITYDKHIYEAQHLIRSRHESNPFVLSMALSLEERINLHQFKSAKPIIPKMRSHFGYNEYDYAVGMVVLLVREPQGDRLGNGVIIDWDYYCAKQHIWHENIGKCDLERPFYSIIKDDGTEIYVSEEKIVGINSHPPKMHDAIIGAHFESFNGSYYEGNHIKRQNYPQDEGYKNDFFLQLIDPYV